MIEYLVTISLILLVIGHGILIHGCMKWANERKTTTALIDDRLATLATLIDEALDMFSGVETLPTTMTPNPHPDVDLKQTLTSLLINKVMGPQLDTDASEEQTWTIQPEEKTQEQPLQEGS